MSPAVRVGDTTIAPTAFGVVGTATVVAVLVARASITDAALAAVVWTALVAFLAIGFLAPLAQVRGLSVELVGDPPETTVGRTELLSLRVRGPALLESVAVDLGGRWWSVLVGPVGEVPIVASSRGIHHAIDVLVRTDGPVGVLRVTRRFRVPIERSWVVGPEPAVQRWSPPEAPDAGDASRTGIAHGGDQVRSVRPYRSGDPAHLVHWPTSARVGSLVVRELEPPRRPGVVVVLAPGSGEAAVGVAAGFALAVLGHGGGVVLCTSEDGRPVTAEVSGRRQVNRRLAAADSGPPGAVPASASQAGWSVEVVGP